jgi:hypothetical protein
MPTPITDRQAPSARSHTHTAQKETAPSRVPPCELPSRAALIAHLEAQRAELLRAMECVNRARRTLEQRVVNHAEKRVLESLDNAKQALATAYPMLEGIAEALHVDEILKEHAS